MHQFIYVYGLVICIVLPLWFNPFSQSPFEPAKVALFQNVTIGVTVAIGISVLFSAIRGGRQPRPTYLVQSLWKSSPLMPPICFFVIASLLAALTSSEGLQSVWEARHSPYGVITLLCELVFFILMVQTCRKQEQINGLVNALLFASVPIVVYGLAQFMGVDPLIWIADPISPVFSTLANPNFLGAYLAMVVPFTLSRCLVTLGRARVVRYGILLFFQVACLWLTLARGAWLALLCGVIVFAIVFWRRQGRKLVLVVAVCLVFGLGLFMIMNISVLRPLYARPDSSVVEDSPTVPVKIETASLQARGVIWARTLDLISQRWLLGYGPGTFERIFNSTYPSALQGIEENAVFQDPHNLLLRIWMETGFVGLLTWLWIVAKSAALILDALKQSSDTETKALLGATSGSLTVFLIQAQFNPVVMTLLVMGWLNLAFCAAMNTLFSSLSRVTGSSDA